MHPRDSLYANYLHQVPGTALICKFHYLPFYPLSSTPRVSRSRGLVALVAYCAAASSRRTWRQWSAMCWPICATMLGQTMTSQRLCRLLAPSAAQAVSNTLLRDDADPVKLVFEGIGTGFLLHAA